MGLLLIFSLLVLPMVYTLPPTSDPIFTYDGTLGCDLYRSVVRSTSSVVERSIQTRVPRRARILRIMGSRLGIYDYAFLGTCWGYESIPSIESKIKIHCVKLLVIAYIVLVL